jgi:plastocyanin
MSDTDTDTDAEAHADAETGTAATTTPAVPAAADAETTERRFWDRPYVERYLSPLLLPLVAVVLVVVLVLNISRVFLSAPGNGAVVIGTIITIGILLGAAFLALAQGLRSGSVALFTVAFLAIVIAAGSVNLGHSEPHGEAEGGTLACDTPAATALDFVAGPNNSLAFDPDTADAPTGLARVEVVDATATEHTFLFEDQATQFEKLTVSGAGTTDACVAFFPEPGDYVFYCDVPGHREAGMEGVVTVEGDPVTLEEAEAAAGEGGGEGGGEPTESTETTTAP